MKNNIVFRGLLVVALALVFAILPFAKIFAADNESVLLSKYIINQIATDGAGTTYVSDSSFKSDFVTLNIPAITIPTTDSHGDAAYSMSYANGYLFVAAGKKDDSNPGNILGGLEVFDPANSYSRTPYGADGTTYRQVVARDDGTVFLSFFDTSYQPYFETASHNGSSVSNLKSLALTPAGTIADITALSVSGNKAFIGLQDDGSGTDGGYVDVVDVTDPSAPSLSPSTYTTSDAVTAVAGNGGVFYVGHGNEIDVVDSSTLAQIGSSIDTGAKVNGIVTDGTYIYVADDTNGLRVYQASDLSPVAKYTVPAETATAVAVDGNYIYFAMSNGIDSTVHKIKMALITLNGDNPQHAEYNQPYSDPGAIVDDPSMTVSSDSATSVDTSNIGTYTVTYTAYDSENNPGVSVERTVNVSDTTAPVITVTGPNPEYVLKGGVYTELGATTDDGSLVQIGGDTVDTSTNGTYYVTYDSVDASGNHATQVTRMVGVVNVVHTITSSVGNSCGASTINPSGAVVVGDGYDQYFTITPDTGCHITDVMVDDGSGPVSVGAVSNYKFESVHNDGTIVASFEANPTSYTITASSNSHGSISPSGAVVVNVGSDQTFTITPDSGSHIADVVVDGVSVGKVNTYTFHNVVSDHTIRANFGSNITGGGSAGGSSSSGPSEIPGCGGRTTGYSTVTGQSCGANGQVLGAEKFNFTLFLKMGHPPYPTGAYMNEVMELQKFLNAAPYNSELVVDGKFGRLTNAAVIKFQLANGLVGDGKVGPLTRAVLNK